MWAQMDTNPGFWLVDWRHHRKWDGKPLSRWKKGWWAHGTGSHVFWKGKPLSSWKKGSWAHGTGSHVFWKGKPLASLKIGSGAQGGVKPLRKRGLKVQSPISATWVIFESKKKDVVFKSRKLIRSSGNRKTMSCTHSPNTNGTSWRHVGKNVLMTDMFSTSHSI